MQPSATVAAASALSVGLLWALCSGSVPGAIAGEPDGRPSPALRLLARATAEDRTRLDALTVQHFAPLLFGLRDVLATALPALSADAKQRRFRLAVDAGLTALVGDEAARMRADGEAAFAAFTRDVARFVAGALEAPE